MTEEFTRISSMLCHTSTSRIDTVNRDSNPYSNHQCKDADNTQFAPIPHLVPNLTSLTLQGSTLPCMWLNVLVSTYIIYCLSTHFSSENNVRDQNMLPQIYHFGVRIIALKAFEIQQIQKEALLELPLCDYKQTFLGNEDCHQFPFLGKFYATTKTFLHKLHFIRFPHVFLPPLGA